MVNNASSRWPHILQFTVVLEKSSIKAILTCLERLPVFQTDAQSCCGDTSRFCTAERTPVTAVATWVGVTGAQTGKLGGSHALLECGTLHVLYSFFFLLSPRFIGNYLQENPWHVT